MRLISLATKQNSTVPSKQTSYIITLCPVRSNTQQKQYLGVLTPLIGHRELLILACKNPTPAISASSPSETKFPEGDQQTTHGEQRETGWTDNS